MLWRDGVPVLYRWKPRGTSVDSELAWYRAYAESKGEELGEVFALDACADSGALPGIVKESLALYPWIGEVNLSRGALDSALVLERAVRVLSRAASWALLMGSFALAGSGLRYYDIRRNIDAVRDRSSDLYRSVFDPARTGRIPDPVALARSRVAELRGGGEGRPLGEVLADLGDIFERNPSMDVSLDSMRYNADGVDYTGSAPDMETIQEFRNAWMERAGAVSPPNMQSAPGVGYRFDISAKW
jgi:hypothetical protein